MAFDAATWEGYWWRGNVPQGVWFPTISSGSAVFTQDDYSVMQLRTLSMDFGSRDVTVSFVPRLDSGGVNGDGANIGFGTDWAAYGSASFAGLSVSQGAIKLIAQSGSDTTAGPTLRSYTPGEAITLTLSYSNGQVTVSGSGITATTWSSGTSLVNPRFVLLGSNSADGISFSCVAPGPATPTRVIGLSGDLSFGNVTVGATSTRTMTISNSGNSTMTVSGISYPGGFSGNWTGTIAAGGSQPVTVTFSPTSAVSYTGTVTVNSDKTGGTNALLASGIGSI